MVKTSKYRSNMEKLSFFIKIGDKKVVIARTPPKVEPIGLIFGSKGFET